MREYPIKSPKDKDDSRQALTISSEKKCSIFKCVYPGRYLLFKKKELCSPTQVHRAEKLFRLYPRLEEAYKLAQKLGHIYQTVKDTGVGDTKLAQWYNEVEKAGFKSFNTVSNTIQSHYETILNFFERMRGTPIDNYFSEFCYRINRSQSKETIFNNIITRMAKGYKLYHAQIVGT